MSTSESFQALRRANPRAKAGFAQSVEAAADAVRAVTTDLGTPPPTRRSHPRRRVLGISAAGVSMAAAAAVAVFLTLGGSPGVGPGVEDAAAAVKKAATVTAASADRSGTAIVRITHNGELWAGKTVRWNGEDIAMSTDEPDRSGKVGSTNLVVDGVLYMQEPRFGWVASDPDAIDPDSGQTPAEDLAAVQEDIGGVTLRRITDGMTALTTSRLDDGSTVYSGTVAAGLIARETGFKEGQSIRVFPFGYVAHDEAADPIAPLDTAVTVGADGIIRDIAVTWGTSASAWTYTVTYSDLGATAAPVAPENARSIEELRGLRAERGN